MSTIVIAKIILLITVVGLFVWSIKYRTNVDDDSLKYGRYMIYLLVFEVAFLVIYDLLQAK